LLVAISDLFPILMALGVAATLLLAVAIGYPARRHLPESTLAPWWKKSCHLDQIWYVRLLHSPIS